MSKNGKLLPDVDLNSFEIRINFVNMAVLEKKSQNWKWISPISTPTITWMKLQDCINWRQVPGTNTLATTSTAQGFLVKDCKWPKPKRECDMLAKFKLNTPKSFTRTNKKIFTEWGLQKNLNQTFPLCQILFFGVTVIGTSVLTKPILVLKGPTSQCHLTT